MACEQRHSGTLQFRTLLVSTSYVDSVLFIECVCDSKLFDNDFFYIYFIIYFANHFVSDSLHSVLPYFTLALESAFVTLPSAEAESV